jgi:hypothetical protein
MLIALLGSSANAQARGGVLATSTALCLLNNSNAVNYEPCAPFTSVPAQLLSRTVFGNVFGPYNRPLVALNDGSAFVTVGWGGLSRIDRYGRVTTLWKPRTEDIERNYLYLDILSPFYAGAIVLYSNQIVGVRADGSLAFRKPVGSLAAITAIPDHEGTVWITGVVDDKEMLFAYLPRTHNVVDVSGQFAQGPILGIPDGRVYKNARDGVFALGSQPSFHWRFVHAPIIAPTPHPGQYGIDWPNPTFDGPHWSFLDVQAVGADESLWASTFTQVIHVHRDGSIHVIRLGSPITSMMVSPGQRFPNPIQLAMTRDGSIWITAEELIRITDDDRVELIGVPGNEHWGRALSFGLDNTGWSLSSVRGGASDSVVHFSIGP